MHKCKVCGNRAVRTKHGWLYCQTYGCPCEGVSIPLRMWEQLMPPTIEPLVWEHFASKGIEKYYADVPQGTYVVHRYKDTKWFWRFDRGPTARGISYQCETAEAGMAKAEQDWKELLAQHVR